MPDQTILILNPGAMGSAIGARLKDLGHDVLWVRQGRSAISTSQAEEAGLRPCDSLSDGLADCGIVVSVCPPHAAVDLARVVAGHRFRGRYIDANAISPQTSAQVAELITDGGGQFTDGGIIGSPPSGKNTTRLYLSGEQAAALAPLFDSERLKTVVLDGDPFAASALKMCFAGWNKARTALLINLRALAASHGVDQALLAEWSAMDPDLLKLFDPAYGGSVMRNAAKAWRWSGEMSEIASTFEAAGLPGGFHHGAADVFERLTEFKDVRDVPTLEALTKSVLR